MTRGVLLFAHGARDPRWSAPFEAVAARLRQAEPGLVVELAYLELMAPDLRAGGERLAAAGCTSIDVIPLFLGAGGHVRKDLPAALDAMRTALPSVTWRLRPPIGEIDSVIEAMALAARALLNEPTADGPA
jgi:sirohydrochlorin cobaltochelatase